MKKQADQCEDRSRFAYRFTGARFETHDDTRENVQQTEHDQKKPHVETRFPVEIKHAHIRVGIDIVEIQSAHAVRGAFLNFGDLIVVELWGVFGVNDRLRRLIVKLVFRPGALDEEGEG